MGGVRILALKSEKQRLVVEVLWEDHLSNTWTGHTCVRFWDSQCDRIVLFHVIRSNFVLNTYKAIIIRQCQRICYGCQSKNPKYPVAK